MRKILGGSIIRVNHADPGRPGDGRKLVNARRAMENGKLPGKPGLLLRIMNRIAIAVMLLLTLSACASEPVRRGAYEAIYQKGCLDRAGKPNCDPEHKSYDQYKKEREESQKP
jgi:hypothetical protein